MHVERSLIPKLLQNANMYRRESLVSFICKHDVIEMHGTKRKGNILVVFQPTMHSTLDIQPTITRVLARNQLIFNSYLNCLSLKVSMVKVELD